MNNTYFNNLLHKKTKKSHLFILFFVAVIAVSSLVGAEAFNVSVTNASGNMLISGNAWSPNTGWISFSGTATDKTPYGVYENPATGALTGNAWSYSQQDPSNSTQPAGLGWLEFGASDSTHPAAKVDFNNSGKIVGYARFISSTGSAWGSPADGWVSFSGTAKSGSSYSIYQGSSCSWSGYAWEPSAAGWISASGMSQNGSSYGVQGTNSGVCSQISQQQLSCSVSKNANQVTYTASPSNLSGYSWKLNGTPKTGNNNTLTFTPLAGKSYAAQVSATVSGSPQTAYCPPVKISSPTGNGAGNGGGNGGSPITAIITANPSRVAENKQTPIEFTWTLKNVKKTDVCGFSKGAVGSQMPGIGGWVSSSKRTPQGAINVKGSVTNMKSTITNTIKTQTEYYIECNGTRVAGSAIVNVVPSFSNF